MQNYYVDIFVLAGYSVPWQAMFGPQTFTIKQLQMKILFKKYSSPLAILGVATWQVTNTINDCLCPLIISSSPPGPPRFPEAAFRPHRSCPLKWLFPGTLAQRWAPGHPFKRVKSILLFHSDSLLLIWVRESFEMAGGSPDPSQALLIRDSSS